MSGDWPPGGLPPVPPEWEDPAEEEFPSEADETQLAEVTAFLAAVPVPALPDAVEARINAALAAEAATRTAPGAPPDTSRTLDRSPKRARVKRHGGSGRPRRDFSRTLLGGGISLVACLILAGLVFALSKGNSSSSSSGAISAGAPQGTTAGPYAAAGSAPEPAASASVPRFSAASPGPTAITDVPKQTAPESTMSTSASSAPSASAPAPTPSAPGPIPSAPAATTSAPKSTPSATAPVSFTVTASGTKYQAATLAAQVQARLNAPAGSGTGTGPSTALRGCVSHLTGGQSPRLVDQATYQGSPAYVIATSSRAWVVGLGCTTANPELVKSVPLAG